MADRTQQILILDKEFLGRFHADAKRMNVTLSTYARVAIENILAYTPRERERRFRDAPKKTTGRPLKVAA